MILYEIFLFLNASIINVTKYQLNDYLIQVYSLTFLIDQNVLYMKLKMK